MSENKRILSLSGGGFLGLYSARVVEEIESMGGDQARQVYDLIAGTSVGGIIALGLAAETRGANIREAFQEFGPRLFKAAAPSTGRLSRSANLLRNLVRPKYDAKILRELIIGVVGSKTKLGDLAQKVVIPAVNLTTGKPCVFKTPHHKNFTRDASLTLVDVALATAAAPTYFGAHRIGSELFADGGLFANSPDDIALAEGLHYLRFDENATKLLSIAVPARRVSISNQNGPDMGVLQWIWDARLSSTLLASQQLNSAAVMRMRLGDRYLRISEDIPSAMEKSIGFDKADEAAQRDLLALAESSVRRLSPRLLQGGFVGGA